jgi:glucose-6-phosphate 1-epimerase
VVWNPWVDKCADLADMPADGWRHMLCVEAAATRPVSLPAGEEWYGRQTLVAV